jgi:CelD/BcsL family acetyltransferase involved in cellulose biosynthesis
MTTVREINDPGELAELGPTWNELLERTPGATFFHSWDWFETYWRHFSARKRLRLLVVSDDGQPTGILPLVVCTTRRSEPVRALTYPLNGWGNFYGPIGPDPPATLSAGLDHILRTPRDWHFIELNWVDAHLDDGHTKRALEGAGLDAVCEEQDTSAIVDLSSHDSWDAYCASHNSNWRSNLRRKEKKLAGEGEITFVRYRSESPKSDPRWDLYDACEAISRASWQHTASSGTMLTKEANRQFYRASHQAAADFGAVDMNLLYLGGRPAAFSYCFHYKGHVTLIKTAFDPAVNSDGTGRIVQARVIADSFARGDSVYDLGPESMEWKQLWLTDMRRIDRYTHFPRRAVMAQLVRAKRAIERPLRRGHAKVDPVAAGA